MSLAQEQIEQLNAELDRARVKSRTTGNRNADYLETYDIIDAANRIFGYDGWTFEVVDVRIENAVSRSGEISGSFFYAIGKLTIGDTVRMDVGSNDIAYRRDDGAASPDSYETSLKGAVSDCLKRCFRTFGNQFGNSLYDKEAGRRQQQAARQTRAARQTKAEPKTERTVDDLLEWAKKEYKLTAEQVLEIVEAKDKSEISDLREAATKVRNYAAGRDLQSEGGQE